MKLKSLIVVATILLTLQSKADQLSDCEKSVENWKGVASSCEDYSRVLEKQRDEAIKRVGDHNDAMPWWSWVIIGAAGGVVLTRGLR